ncbi:MAG: DUF423 domain-containing protein [Aureliella sp.]
MIAALLGAAGVAIGAYAAHGLEKSLVEQTIGPEEIADRLRQCDVAVRYHMLHVVVLLIVGLGTLRATKILAVSALFFLLGMLLFCGGLYSMVFTGVMGHWAIVPAGGMCFLVGWIMLALAALLSGNDGSIAADG